MSSSAQERPRRESPAQRALRIAWLRDEVASGEYFVPAEVVARSILQRLQRLGRFRGRELDLFGLQHQ
jgi:anti-sigma28 factor (negative regulator of flagellin synthesis)